jgi:hypothetical protein
LNKPDLSVTIIVRDCRDLLLNCLKSLHERLGGGLDYEVLVLDNASTDGTSEAVQEASPEVRLFHNTENRGVAPARNQLIQKAAGRYILILDADTEVVSENFHDLIAYMDSHPDVGILGCTLVSEDNVIHSSTRTYPRPIHVLLRRLEMAGIVRDSRILREHHLAGWDRSGPRVVDFVEGAFKLIRREAVDKVGLLDESMFYGFEDADYCARMEKAGLKVVCYPGFVVRHLLQGITRKNPFNKMAYLHTKSYVIFYRKHRDLIRKKCQSRY